MGELASKAFGTFIGIFIMFNVFGGFVLLENYAIIYFAIAIVIYLGSMLGESEKYFREKLWNESRTEVENLKNEIINDKNYINDLERHNEGLTEEKEIYRTSLVEKNKFFPTLLNAIEQYEARKDEDIEVYLRCKKNPSKKGSEVVREQNQRRRQAEQELKKSNLLIEYYETMAPFLVELKEDLAIPDENILEDYSEDEQLDFVTKYLSKEEYRKLPSVERNQMALDRFWKKPNKSNWLLGLLYERYTGYLYESKGYDVKYHGAKEGKKDLGRDLICEKGNEILVVQCKYWSQFKTIHEKHIFQLFGTTFQYKYKLEQENKSKKIRAIFHTSTSLSEVARRFAKELNIDVKENIRLNREYPCIKCNIGRVSEEKIYHLPFDQQYDNIIIEPKRGEFYCCTVKEAEDAGFRRAFRYKGIAKK